ncbi:MAG: D-cysteine desulfhydrase family protein [Candidatus Hodarchaeota archaeon]
MSVFNLEEIPRIYLCSLPTPIEPLKRLSKHLGSINIFIKRDDLTGIAFGGNKNRKLEFLLADAIEKGSDVIITEGAIQSNHCLQTAACASKIGLECELVLSGAAPDFITGNLLLDQILDVKIHRIRENSDRSRYMKKLEQHLKSEGKKPYIIPTGGSTKIGALGYLKCLSEILIQSNEMHITFNYLVHSTGSGGTQSGTLIGKEFYYPELEVFGVSEGEPKEKLISEIKKIMREFDKEWNTNINFEKIEINVLEGYFGAGYGIVNQELIDTVKLVAKLEGIFLDPVYNGKAMIGLIDLIKTEVIPRNTNVLFLHSGGGPAIFNYSTEFGKSLK